MSFLLCFIFSNDSTDTVGHGVGHWIGHGMTVGHGMTFGHGMVMKWQLVLEWPFWPGFALFTMIHPLPSWAPSFTLFLPYAVSAVSAVPSPNTLLWSMVGVSHGSMPIILSQNMCNGVPWRGLVKKSANILIDRHLSTLDVVSDKEIANVDVLGLFATGGPSIFLEKDSTLVVLVNNWFLDWVPLWLQEILCP